MHRLSIRADEHGRRRCLRLRHSLRWLQPRLLQEPVRRGCAGVRMHPVPCRLLLHGRSLPYLGHLSSRNVSFSIFLLSPPPTLPFQKKQGCAITYWAGRFGTRPSQTPQCTAALGLRATFEGFLLHPGFTLDSAKSGESARVALSYCVPRYLRACIASASFNSRMAESSVPRVAVRLPWNRQELL